MERSKKNQNNDRFAVLGSLCNMNMQKNNNLMPTFHFFLFVANSHGTHSLAPYSFTGGVYCINLVPKNFQFNFFLQ